MDKFVCAADYPVVQTEAGKLRGYVWNDTFIFKGIKYADAKRFRRPEKVQPWEGIRDAQSYGMVCPLLEQDKPGMELLVPHMYWPMDENCQYLNIWTQSIDKEAKKPVMVWLHGGGFFAGSSIEQIAYDGENMSREGDVVVVSLNHRLNVLGYLDLSPFGAEYEASANAGSLDMIAALQWVHDNIAAFGGDPGNVTIFGQSGGGAKVWTLMQMPAADGLFHKGIVQSGIYEMLGDVENQDGTQIVEAILKELGLGRGDVKQLETIPYDQLAAAYKKAAPAIQASGGYVGNEPHISKDYVGDPIHHGFREHAQKIPVLIGTVLGEFDFRMPLAGKWKFDRETALSYVRKRFGDGAEQIMDLFTQIYPEKCPVDARSVDFLFRGPTIDFIKERSKTPESVTYSYQLTYDFPVFDGKVAWHCSEIPYVFHNMDKVPVCAGAGGEQLQETIFGSWMRFAKTGSPQAEGFAWPACTEGDEAMMLLDQNCRIVHNADHELVRLAKQLELAVREDDTGEIQH